MRKGSLCVFIILFTNTLLYSSVKNINTLLSKLSFDKAKVLLDKEAIKDSTNYAYNYLYANYYINPTNNNKDIYQALKQINICSIKYNANSNAKLLLKNNKILITSEQINSLYHQIELEAYYQARLKNQLSDYELALSNPFLDTIFIADLTMYRDNLAYIEANQKNDFLSFKDFMEKYPDANQAGLAKENYEKLLYKSVTDLNTWQAYKSYIDQYPNAQFNKEAVIKYEQLLYLAFSKDNNEQKLYDYIQHYPNASFIKEASIKLFKLKCNELSDAQFISFIEKYPKCIIGVKKAWDYLYYYNTSDDKPSSYILFIEKYKQYYNYNQFKEDSSKSYLNIKSFEKDEMYGFIKDDSIIILDAQFKEVGEFNSKFALVSDFCKDKCEYSYINKDGKIMFSNFDEAYDFSYGVAIIGSGECPEKNCLYGLINEMNDTILPLEYTNINDLYDGLFLVTDNKGLSGYVSNRGKIIIPIQYIKARNFKDSLALVCMDTNCFFINTLGEIQKQLPYFKLASDFKEGISSFSIDNNLWGIMNKKGEIIHSPIYKNIIEFENGIAITSKEDSVTKKGKTTYKLNTYELHLDGTSILKK